MIDEHDLAPHIRYRHRVDTAEWSTDERRWTVTVNRPDTGETRTFSAGFLWMCQGYYRHDAGYTPKWPGLDDFQGEVIHPQTWPDDLDLDGKKVVVIGSGATAATLIPAIADHCALVTMLQRSPTFYITGPNATIWPTRCGLDIPSNGRTRSSGARCSRRRTSSPRCGSTPEMARQFLLESSGAELPGASRLRSTSTRAIGLGSSASPLPEGDLFKSIRKVKASVVTDDIETFDAQASS